ncbi:putative oxidoreductase C-terminal domain-containing protein [Parapedobacter lycopersici]|uniref:putative oxidoreductase C-terminal domain-containing protein n=1 Tax=Parapedobacter lycopersici TaxID=1864939 RepID=UPI00333E87E3
MKTNTPICMILIMGLAACGNKQHAGQTQETIKLVTVAPGHFHASLVQKSAYPGVSDTAYVYAPDGPELKAHLALITQYNSRPDHPTHWKEVVYSGADFMEKMLDERKGNVVVLSGNNQHKMDYIGQAVAAGLHVLADKPMIIRHVDFPRLEAAFAQALENHVVLYDIMTERYEINTILQKELSQLPEFFGGLVTGDAEHPAITKESVHHFFKEVSGKPLIRPAWFYDTRQQGEGLVDITTHLVDLVQWESFPEEVIHYDRDIEVINAKRWPAIVTPAQFTQSTQTPDFPEYLRDALDSNGNLAVFANGEINYRIRGIHARVSVVWNFEAPEGAGDTHYSIMRGRYANLIIKQGKAESYKPVLYVQPTEERDVASFESALGDAMNRLGATYPGLTFERLPDGLYRIGVDSALVTSHEEHFAQVTEKYLSFLGSGTLPDWEVPNMLAKYYVTTKALEVAETTGPE